MSTRFFTNEAENTLLKKFAGVFEHNPDIAFFDALVGFFRASGYFSLRPHLEAVPNIRVLVGINVDAVTAKYHSQGLLFKGDPTQAVADVMTGMKADIQDAEYRQETEAGILQFVDDVVSGKLEIKAHPSRNLHAKIYIFRPENFNEHHSGQVITGSSNLTDAGLGTHDSSNYEFNVLLNNYDDVKFATDEFEKLWQEGVPILPADVRKVRKETFLNEDFSPFEIYIKFLIEYFGRSVDFDPNSVADLPSGFKRLSYQIDAVNQGFEMLKHHDGFFLADVVGLGKTVVATLIAKKFFYTNGYPNHNSRTLIVVPPALRDNWEDTLSRFNMHNYRIVNNGSLHKVRNPGKYDLVIVDEAHKFRNDTANGYTALQKLCKTPSPRVLENGMKMRKKIMLVSATPLNNRPEDIRNQVYLFQDGKDSSLAMGNLNGFFASRIDEYRQAKKMKSVAHAQDAVAKIYEQIRQHVIQPLTVRRTRTDLMRNEAYKKDLDSQGIFFPEIEKPRRLLYLLDENLEKLFDRTVELLADPEVGMTYNRYRAIQYLVPSKKLKYQNADMLSTQLAKIMKTLLVKRLDSSFHAFKQSLKRFRDATQVMVTMFEQGRIYIAPNADVNQYILDEREEDLIELLAGLKETDDTIEFCKPEDFSSGFKNGLDKDLSILQELSDAWEAVGQDPKLDTFLEKLDGELLAPATNPQGKLVVFSESKETSRYLAERLKAHGYKGTLAIDAKNRKHMRHVVRNNFDANVPATEQADDYRILISTEVLAEGVNLHRSNVIVNYDTPWNSTRLMQRIGRVNRIGSVAPKVFNYVFYPTAKVDDDIELRKRAVMKLQAFHSALGEDSQIYSHEEQVETFGLFDENIEEDRDESLALLMDLRKYREENPGRFREIRNMPRRARCGRRDKTKKESTVVFLRNPRRDAFYCANPDQTLTELTFIKCARIFRASEKEKAIVLHEQHHEQVRLAEQDFAEKIQAEAAAGKVVDLQQGPREKKALSFVDAAVKMPGTGEGEKALMKAAKTAIRLGKFQQLSRDINKLAGKIKKEKQGIARILDGLMDILGRYPLADQESLAQRKMPRDGKALKPAIIISESFSK